MSFFRKRSFGKNGRVLKKIGSIALGLMVIGASGIVLKRDFAESKVKIQELMVNEQIVSSFSIGEWTCQLSCKTNEEQSEGVFSLYVLGQKGMTYEKRDFCHGFQNQMLSKYVFKTTDFNQDGRPEVLFQFNLSDQHQYVFYGLIEGGKIKP